MRSRTTRERSTQGDWTGRLATQLMRMYRIARVMSNPVILELGTDTGASATVFLQACEEADGRLVSVDIRDCSDVCTSSRWNFVQCDSVDIDFVLSRAPHLRDGIDILYVDSMHRKSHVEKELMGWYPFMTQGAHIFFDDVDSNPYRKGQRKDNFFAEVDLGRNTRVLGGVLLFERRRALHGYDVRHHGVGTLLQA